MTASSSSFQESAFQARRKSASDILKIRNVSKSYTIDNRAMQVLDNISIDIPNSSFVSIVGPSGCGKSTLLRLIVGLDTNYEGQILLNGSPVRGPGSERAIVFQEHRLFPWLTVEDNIALALDPHEVSKADKKRRVAEHIGLVGLETFEKAFPSQLSGGMAQRAAIARALVVSPQILLLDEPLGALDALTRIYLQDELLRIWRQESVTVVMVTHDVEEAVYLSDEVIVMDPRPGRIAEVISIQRAGGRHRGDTDLVAIKQQILNRLKK